MINPPFKAIELRADIFAPTIYIFAPTIYLALPFVNFIEISLNRSKIRLDSLFDNLANLLNFLFSDGHMLYSAAFNLSMAVSGSSTPKI